MPVYSCKAIIISSIVCTVEATSIEDAKKLFQTNLWDDYHDDGSVYEVTCDLETTIEEKT